MRALPLSPFCFLFNRMTFINGIGCRPTHSLTIPLLQFKVDLTSYYKGGFEEKMSRREASLILGVRYLENM